MFIVVGGLLCLLVLVFLSGGGFVFSSFAVGVGLVVSLGVYFVVVLL